MCEFGEYLANPIAFGRFGKNCANGLGCLLFRNSRWTKGWKFDRSGSSTTASAKDMKIYTGLYK